MRYPAYSELSPQRLPSGEAIPVGWEAKKLKFLGEPIIGLTYSPDDIVDVQNGTLVLRANNIQGGKLVPDDAVFVSTYVPDKLRLNLGDILICTRNGSRHLIGKNGLVTPEFEGSTFGAFNTVFRSDVNPFLYHVFNSSLFEFQSGSYLTSTINQLTISTLSSIVVPIPPPEEQKTIAAFLDWKMGQIDELMARKKDLLEKLKEKRLAVITQAVTRGLDPAVPLRDSGILWLGNVPAHWETANIRRFAVMRTGHTPSRNEASYWDNCDIPWFTLADVWQLRDGRKVYLGETKERISSVGLANSAAELLPPGTVIFSRTASVGFSGIMPTAMATTQDFWNWIPGPKLVSEYLLFQFRAMSQEFEKLTMGSTHKTIYQPDAASLRICVPPISEQKAIVHHIVGSTSKLDTLTDTIEAAIGRLAEYRTALITAATTGKIDVRGVKVTHPAA